MGKNKIRAVTFILSFILIISVFAVGCAPQQRPVPDERYGTRFDMGTQYYNNRYAYDYDTEYNRRINDYGPLYRPGTDRLYGYYYDIGPDRRGLTYDNIPPMNTNMREGYMNTALVNRMENEVEQINNVDKATVIRNNDTCYVGIDTENGKNIENVAALRTDVANRIRRIDPTVKRVFVTTDKNRVNRLRTFARDIDIGRPIRDFVDEIEDLFD